MCVRMNTLSVFLLQGKCEDERGVKCGQRATPVCLWAQVQLQGVKQPDQLFCTVAPSSGQRVKRHLGDHLKMLAFSWQTVSLWWFTWCLAEHVSYHSRRQSIVNEMLLSATWRWEEIHEYQVNASFEFELWGPCFNIWVKLNRFLWVIAS